MAEINSGKRVTLGDIAKATGYSTNAVSRALRDMPDIGPETRAYIRQTARDMGYVANRMAASLRDGRTRLIAVIVSDLTNPFYGVMGDQIQQQAAAAGYSTMFLCSRSNPELEIEMVNQALSHCVDGVLLFPTAGNEASVERLHAANVPVVLMTRCFEKGKDDCVIFDDERGAYLATRHLIAAGHKRVAYLSSSNVLSASELRVAGFRRACAEAGISEKDHCEHVTAYYGKNPAQSEEWLEEAVTRLIRLRDEGYTGAFVFCDVEAWHFINAMQRSGRIDPKSFGIVGFDNIDGALATPVPLCSVDCKPAEMCRKAFELLRLRIGGDKRPVQTIVCEPEIICRGSCHGC